MVRGGAVHQTHGNGWLLHYTERERVNRAWNEERKGVVSDVLFGEKDAMNDSAQRRVTCVEVVSNASFGVKDVMNASEQSFVSDAGRLTCH